MKAHFLAVAVVLLLVGYYAGVTYPSLPAKLKSMF